MADERGWTGSRRGRAHRASGTGPVPEPRTVRARRMGKALALAGGVAFVLGLGVGGWVLSPPPPGTDFLPFADGGTPDAGGVACPRPAEPFGHQALTPCKRRETEFSGGCWQAIDQRPPCDQDVREHQGRCYIPVGKRPRLPQTVEPQEP